MEAACSCASVDGSIGLASARTEAQQHCFAQNSCRTTFALYQVAVAAHAAAVIGPPSDAPEFEGLEEKGRIRTNGVPLVTAARSAVNSRCGSRGAGCRRGESRRDCLSRKARVSRAARY